ncbi:glycosyltransferase [Cohnella sp. CFH 77786]|uniref:glycosyltransferase n=1 Tax=Cohnella sp. CFH 77786 TaxID=2662265 RepID=UPI001C60D18B|nr:glycosyltransferase [Cohnella sp. CFH 77786]MBW5448335.1 glycosyltransferase [Cohnella sp. CFH 77786]
MSRLLGYDLSSDGHHRLYNLTVMQHLSKQNQYDQVGYYTLNAGEELVSELKGCGIKVRNLPPLRDSTGRLSLLRRTMCLLGMFLYARRYGYDKVHLFHLDSAIVSLLLAMPLAAGIRVTGTLHWYPTKRLKRWLMFLLLKLRVIDKVAVHGNFTHARILRDGCDESKVANIHIPYFKRESGGVDAQEQDILHALSGRKRPYLLCFGGMRYDKGIDILMESLSYLRDLDFTVIVAGSEDHFTEADLDRWAMEYGIADRLHKDIRYIPESLKTQYLELCDAVILPYRGMFSGISGPLTEGAAHHKFVLGPNHGEIGYTIETYGLGDTFEAENRSDLTDKLRKLLNRLKRGEAAESSPNTTSLFSRFIRDEKLFGENYRKFLA